MISVIQNISQRIEDIPCLQQFIFFSDEAHFHLSGHVNKQSLRFLASEHPPEHPHEHVQPSFSHEKVTVRCAIGCNETFGPYWFQDTDGGCVTVDTDRYITLMRTKFMPALRRRRDVDVNTVIFQHDGATPHCSNITLEYLRHHFPEDTLISRRTCVLWPPYSRDLNPAEKLPLGESERQSLFKQSS